MKGYYSYIYSTVIGIGMVVAISLNHSKTAYIDMSKVIDGYEMKVDLENLLNHELQSRKQGLDAIAAEMDSIKSIDSLEYNKYKRYYFHASEELSKFKDGKANEIRTQVITNINNAVIKFGEESGYDYILGANGNGSIMYANDSEDVTDELITYLNEKYGK